MKRCLSILAAAVFWQSAVAFSADSVRVASFDVDATPPLGSAMAYDPVKRIDELSLRARGIVILGAGEPIVLCAVDWIGIANEGHDVFRAALAEAAGTVPGRVALHALHQHDAPGCDFTAEKIVKELGINGFTRFDGTFHRIVIQRAADAIRAALPNTQAVTHYGYGEAVVKEVASNRRVERTADGKVGRMRGSSCKIEGLIVLPEGVIDPVVSVLSFWNGDKPVAVLSAYACHPQSYYRLGIPSPDFPGIARFIRGQDVNAALHVHFNGAGGNVAAGKYNNGAQANRMILATRLASGMREAFDKSTKVPLAAADIGWGSVLVHLPLSPRLDEADLIAKLKSTPAKGYISFADQLAFVRRVKAGVPIDITCLSIGTARMLHLPGELFVEYQLAAKAMRPDLKVMMAAYGNYGPGYIGTAVAYPEGGYETGPTSSNVAPEVEPILMDAMKQLLVSPPAVAEVITTKTTYSKAYGTTKNPVTLDPTKDLPHYPAVESGDAIKTWKVKPGFQLQLAAHEPQVRDPIAICFDERGRMFACEMIDYSEMRDSSPHLGRVSVLEDRDGDGYYETSQVFADNLPWPTGLIWANGGLYVGATPDIWRFEDRDADGSAEVREKIYSGFGTGLKMLNVQGLLNSFQWGQDNRVHVLAGGGNRGMVTCLKRPDLPGQELSGRDFWFDPLNHEFGMETGGAQYGMSFDNYARKFGCSNSDHLQHWVYEGDSGGQLPPARQSIAVDGGAAEVFRRSPDEPWRIVRTRWRVAGTVPGTVEGGGRVSGYFTGATGTTIYRGDAYGPDFVNNSFTGDAGGQLVHRKIIRPAADGVNLAGERPADEQGFEFAASNDTWVRIVNFANAPDGCLHIIDMYREIIEHPWSIPDEIKKHLDLNHGNDRGRIYRLVPESGGPRTGQKVDLSGVDVPGLVKLLSHANGWHRDTAQRLLHERQDKAAIPLLEGVIAGNDPLAKLHALGTLASQKAISESILIAALGDADTHVRERTLVLAASLEPSAPLIQKIAVLSADSSLRVRFQVARTISSLLKKNSSPELESALTRLAKQDHAHPWISPALLTAPPALLSSRIFTALTRDPVLSVQASSFIARLIEIRAATSSPEDHVELIDWIASRSVPNPLWIGALGEGLRRGKSSIEKADKNHALTLLFKQAATTVLNSAAASGDRLAGLELLRFAGLDDSRFALLACLVENQPEALQTAALKILAQHVSPQVDQLILQNWPHYTTQARTTALEQMLARQDRQITLLAAIKSGTIPAAALSAAQVQALVQHKDTKIVALAREALAAVIPPSRAEVAAKFRDAVTTKGDALRGQAQFMQRCLICHRAAGMGLEVGPDLVTVKAKGREALLSAILEPGKEVAAQYILYTVNTRDGGTYAGVIAEDNATAMTLKMAGGATHKVERANIKGSSSSGQSLMPDGLEAGMTVLDMADLLTFIEELK